MIPRVFHHVWVGDPMPDHLAAYVATWTRLHPEWEHRLWGESDLTWLANRDLFDNASHYAPGHEGQFRSDLARYEILHEHGGVYIDADLECLQPIDELIAGVDCFAAWETDGVWLANTIMGSVPGHPFLTDILAGLRQNIAVTKGPKSRPNKLTGPRYVTRVAHRHDDVTRFSSAVFLPARWDQLDARPEDYPDAHSFHWWANQRRLRGESVA